jgi:DNA-binding NarL/FixJ family response regulator
VPARKPSPRARKSDGSSLASTGEETLVAVLGEGGAFATEALVWTLEETGRRVLGVHRSVRELQLDLRSSGAKAHVVFVDADDPTRGVSALAEIRQIDPRLKVMLLCDELTPSILRRAIEQRVEGVVLKSDSVEDLLAAFEHVLDGRAVMPCGWQDVPVEPENADPVESLSMREREVLELAAGGMRNREIAERLMISPNTVKFHLRAIYARLGVHNRVQVARALAAASAAGETRQEMCPTGSNTLDRDNRAH